MGYLILKPAQGERAYAIAAEVFQQMYRQITGTLLPISDSDDGISDLILIGNDAVNDFVMEKMLDNSIKNLGIRYGTDDYCIRSGCVDRRKYLLLAGGRGRSVLYAVYDFFEIQAGCHYFWDGDVIPENKSFDIGEIDVLKSPRFEYRGLRYFAHRGLKRFQAEHWSLEDWKQEIDWMLKKRLNFFMLRIGMDDLWQRVFPETVPYPSPNETKAKGGFGDRSPFWPLEYRGILRQKLLHYALERDLMHPEDCGTMSHWYSPAPNEFLDNDKQITFLSQADDMYNMRESLVWDIRKQHNMERYMQLTDGYVKEFNPNAQLFHTIGLAERIMNSNRDDNLRLKLFTYRKIAQNLREHYPNSKLLLASWDFIGWWNSEEVKELTKELDPERTMILDYTSEVDDPEQCFLNWGVVGKFPWIFGIFHAFEAESSLRGPYDRIAERLRVAADDTFCKGMILWPELSHSDPLMLEYLAENAWSPLEMTVEQLAGRFCEQRYGRYSQVLNEIWQELLPVIKLCDWGGYTRRTEEDKDYEKYLRGWYVHREMWSSISRVFGTLGDSHTKAHFNYKLEEFRAVAKNMSKALTMLSELPQSAWDEPFIHRDGIDLARFAIGRSMNYLLMQIVVLFNDGKYQEINALKDIFNELMQHLINLLGYHKDYSMYQTLLEIAETCPINPNFETTLKHNLVNNYCRQYAYEPMKYLFQYECEVVLNALSSNDEVAVTSHCEKELSKLEAEFMNRPLAEMQPSSTDDISEVLISAGRTLQRWTV